MVGHRRREWKILKHTSSSKYSTRGEGIEKEEFELIFHTKFVEEMGNRTIEDVGASRSKLRTVFAVCARLKKVRKDCIALEGVLKTLKLANPTGVPTEVDLMNAGPHFLFLLVWNRRSSSICCILYSYSYETRAQY